MPASSSVSPSASSSKSPSASRSPSASKSPSASVSPSASLSPSTSVSPSVSPSFPGSMYTWAEIRPLGDTNQNWTGLATDSDGSVILASTSTRLYLSTNSGSSWAETQPAGNINRQWQYLSMDADGSVLVAAFNTFGSIYVSTNGGSSWNARLSSIRWLSIDVNDDGSCIIAGATDGVYISTDSGVNFSNLSPATADNGWQAVSVDSDGSNWFAVNDSESRDFWGHAYISTNSGTSWTETATSISKNWYGGGSNSTGSSLVLVPSYNDDVMYGSTNGGTNWNNITPSLVDNINYYIGTFCDIKGTYLSQLVYELSSNYTRFLISTDSGSTWNEIQPILGSGARNWWTSVFSANASVIIIDEYGGRIWYGLRTQSASVSPSSSTSPSASVSPSLSLSPSASESASLSPSQSASPSASLSPSASASPSTPVVGYVMYRWDGSQWVRAKLKTFIGGSWQLKPVKVYLNGIWEDVDASG